MSRAPLLIENKELLSTALNTSWMTSTLWLSASGATTTFQHPIGKALGGLLHYGPGHIRHWEQVNRYMDSVRGSGHRLKFGHSVDNLPEICRRFGIGGVPAYFCHMLQDFTTVDGVPFLPHSLAIKGYLQHLGISAKVATSLVSLTASHVLAGAMIATAIWKSQEQRERGDRKRKLLASAESAAENMDYTGAIESYKRALELGRDPSVLIALGQVYLRRPASRPYAHRAFTDAVQILGSDTTKTFTYHGAQLSLRGIAGLHALATADVIGERYPEYWEEQVESLVNATIHSFASTASKLEVQPDRSISQPLTRPRYFSAALNRYLAAQTSCQYPLLDGRQDLVKTQITAAMGLLGRVAQQSEQALREPADQLRGVWVRTVLPEDEADVILATA